MTLTPERQAKRPRIEKAQGRNVAEWFGKTPEEMPPPHIRLRIFRRFDGRCHITGRKIGGGEDWHCDHVKPIEDGGENRERNMAPALDFAHRAKTGEENGARAKADRIATKHLGLKPKSKRGFPKHLTKRMDGTVVPRGGRA